MNSLTYTVVMFMWFGIEATPLTFAVALVVAIVVDGAPERVSRFWKKV